MPGSPHGNGGGVPSFFLLASVLLWDTPRPSKGLGTASQPLPEDGSSSVDLPVMVQAPSSALLLSLITSFFQQCVHVPSSVVFVIRVCPLKTLFKHYLNAISGRRGYKPVCCSICGFNPRPVHFLWKPIRGILPQGEKNAAQLSALKHAVFSDKFTKYPDFSCAWFLTVKVAMGAGEAWWDMQWPTLIKCQFYTQRTALYLLRHQVQITEIKRMFTCLVWLSLQSINFHSPLWSRWKLSKLLSLELWSIRLHLCSRLPTGHWYCLHLWPPAGRILPYSSPCTKQLNE